MVFQNVFADQASGKQEHQHINEKQAAHRGKARQGLEARDYGKYDCGWNVNKFVNEQSCAHSRHIRNLARFSNAAEPPHNDEWSYHAQPFKPMPASDVVKRMRQRNKVIRLRWRSEGDTKRQAGMGQRKATPR